MKKLYYIFVSLALGVCAHASDLLRVACIGDSITYGHGVKDRGQNSYPKQLSKLLGSGYEVRNFGVSGSTLL